MSELINLKNKAAFQVLFFFSLVLFSCGGAFKKNKNPDIRIDGSGSVFIATEAAAEIFRQQAPQSHILIGISGTTAGFRKFAAGEIAICDASRPIHSSEDSLCLTNGISYLEIPICYDGIALLVNKRNTWVNDLSIDELHRIWEPGAEAKIVYWDQIRTSWPHKPLRLYGPGQNSGTFEYFTEVVNGKAKASRGDYTASHDPNILVSSVMADQNGLGYFAYTYYAENKNSLKLVPIREKRGSDAILASPASILNGSYHFSRILFLYVNKNALKQQDLHDFMRFYLDHARQIVQQSGYIPFSPDFYKHFGNNFFSEKAGSAFLNRKRNGTCSLDSLISIERQYYDNQNQDSQTSTK